jgi:hypothetical protein
LLADRVINRFRDGLEGGGVVVNNFVHCYNFGRLLYIYIPDTLFMFFL